jgi:hypothetical protein
MPDLLPCKTCPWRVDRDATTIPRYVHDKAVDLLDSVGDGDDFRPVMSCHYHGGDEGVACKGYLAREGWSNLYVRLLLARGAIANPTDVAEACEAAGIALEPDWPTALAKLAKSIGEPIGDDPCDRS